MFQHLSMFETCTHTHTYIYIHTHIDQFKSSKFWWILAHSSADVLDSEEPGSGERETFMSLVKRRRVCMMHFLGPRTGTLKLLPRADRPEITIEASLPSPVSEPNHYYVSKLASSY